MYKAQRRFDSQRIDDVDRLRARLALVATRGSERRAQVSVDDLIALREGRLSPNSREQILEVLDSCPECYEEWLFVNRFLDDEERQADSSKRRKLRRSVPFIIRHQATAVAATVVLAVSLVLFLVQEPSIDQSVNMAYESAIQSGLLPEQPEQLIAGDGVEYAFGGAESREIASTAFAAGVWLANHVLQGDVTSAYPQDLLPPDVAAASLRDDPWRHTEWSIYLDTARWLILVVEVCKRPEHLSPPFWEEQYEVFSRIKVALADKADQDRFPKAVLGRLRRMDSAYSDLTRGDAGGRSCALVEREVRALLGKLRIIRP